MKRIPVDPSRRAMVAALLALGAGVPGAAANAAEEARVIPPYASDLVATPPAAEEIALLAGGCFWGVQGVFQHVKGVKGAVSGYAGGERNTATYELIGTGKTGHAETVRVIFNPREISFAKILQIFFSVVHDPTQFNRQGPDEGPQYRSAIFPTTPEQTRIAEAYIAQLNGARIFPAAIVTKVEQGKTFYPAELYHQDFLIRNPTHPYIVRNDLPKVDNLKRIFTDAYRSHPILVLGAPAAKG